MGMGIHIRRGAMGGPTGMADATGALQPTLLLDLVVQILDAAFCLDDPNAIGLHSCHTGRIISPVLQLIQPLQQNRNRFFAAYISYYSTHK